MERTFKMFQFKTKKVHLTGRVQGWVTYKKLSKQSHKETFKSLKLMKICKINLTTLQISTASTSCSSLMTPRKGARKKYILKRTTKGQNLLRTGCSLLSCRILAISIFTTHNAFNLMTIKPHWKNRGLKWHPKYFKISRGLKSFN